MNQSTNQPVNQSTVAEFSPEWQAIQYGLGRQVPVRFMDLPQTHQLAIESQRIEQAAAKAKAGEDESAAGAGPGTEAPGPQAPEANESPAGAARDVRRDPLSALAAACGYSDGERWWDHMVETRRDGAGLFAAILEAMTALREQEDVPPTAKATLPGEAAAPADGAAPANAAAPTAAPTPADAFLPGDQQDEPLREAYMRQALRAAQKEGFEKIAVVCGAWHGPALARLGPAGKDAALLKGLPKIKVSCTWVPWTYGRLTFASGYGAGVHSPGWYHHLWQVRRAGHGATDASIRWLTRVARLLREEDYDVSSAHVIEAVRLAESLAGLRNSPLPGLEELNEACRSVLVFRRRPAAGAGAPAADRRRADGPGAAGHADRPAPAGPGAAAEAAAPARVRPGQELRPGPPQRHRPGPQPPAAPPGPAGRRLGAAQSLVDWLTG